MFFSIFCFLTKLKYKIGFGEKDVFNGALQKSLEIYKQFQTKLFGSFPRDS
jgi:hypothetical protein